MTRAHLIGRQLDLVPAPTMGAPRMNEVPVGPAHAVPEDGDQDRGACGVPVHRIAGTWPPRGLASPTPCPACARLVGD